MKSKGFAPESKLERDKSKMTAKQTLQEWMSCFKTLEDPRGKQGREHEFLSIVMIAILAVIGGALRWDDIELYAESHQVWLEQLLNLKNGVPHADTYRRVFALINPESRQNCFISWIQQIATEIEGDCLRSTASNREVHTIAMLKSRLSNRLRRFDVADATAAAWRLR